MSIMKRSLFALALLSMTASVLPYYRHGGYYGRGGGDFGGGLATGLVVGGLTGAAISSSNRRSDPDYRLNRDLNTQIRRTEKDLDRAERDIENARSERSKSRAQERAQRLTSKLNSLNRRYAQAYA